MIPEEFVGPAAGVATSLLWVFTALFFAAGTRRIGTTAVNSLRLMLAVVLLGVTHRLLSGAWFPEISGEQVFYLALSGVLGLSICDQALFSAFREIGPRRAQLVMTTSPLFALILGFVFLGERVGPLAILGILMTVGGVAWGVLERQAATEDAHPIEHARRGIVFAVIAAAFQAAGLMLSKLGMGHGLSEGTPELTPQAATFVRMIFGVAGMVPLILIVLIRGRRGRPPRRCGRVSAGVAFTAMGAVVGPFIGVWMSLVAADNAPVGVAQTLCSLSPVFILPFAMVIDKEKIGVRAILGAVLAVAGSAVLFVA